MPWNIVEDHPECSGYAVVKEDGGELVGCHETRAEAEAHVAAMYASEEEMMVKASGGYLAMIGAPVKALGAGKVGGYLVRFTDASQPDLDGDYFDAATDFGELMSSPVYYQHGLDPVMKTRKLGRAALTRDGFGIWAEAQLELRDEYEKFIYGMAEAGKMAWSSGTAGHLIEREQVAGARHIKSWPLGLDASLTPTPSEPRNQAVPLKSLAGKSIADLAQAITAQAAQTEAIGAAADAIVKSNIEPGDEPTTRTTYAVVREETMPDNTQPQDGKVDALEAQMKQMSDAMNRILAAIEAEPDNERAGYLTNLGGTADEGHKSLGDYLLSIKRGDHKRLTKVYKSYVARDDGNVKDVLVDTGVSGGYVVPTDYSAQLLQVTPANSPIVARTNQVPVALPSGEWPAFDLAVGVTAGAGDTNLAAGLVATVTEEAATLTEDTPVFRAIEWRLHKVGRYVEVSNEFQADSPVAIENLLRGLINLAINSKNERNVLRGSGAGEPLGILNAGCTIALATASDNTFGEADALAMLSRHKNMSGQLSAWIMSPTVIPDLAAFADSSYNPIVHFVEGVRGMLLGLPILYSEHMPIANGDDVILADLGSYYFWHKPLEISFSEHAAFTRDMGTWRYSQRNDGKPALNSAITGADPGGSTTYSPFIFHDD